MKCSGLLSSCQTRTGPKGLEGLSVRQWTCSVCGTAHDRDTKAAKNILERGLLESEKEFSMAAEVQTWGFAKTNVAAVNEGSQESGARHDPLLVFNCVN